ncbi:MAG TPA: hypothetical protein VHG28_03720 [Longimicrobiaceae bacterium]|nr:hypothetical protein [Longimicrobiaceae bacterium]
MSSHPALPVTRAQRARAYAVHLYTASGVVLALLAAVETCAPEPEPRWVFLWLALAVVVDSTDGPLARRWHTKTWAPRIDGRTIDDIVDYLTYTFLPLLLVWRMGWLPAPGEVWVAPALMASLLGFANTGAKDEQGGFFLGFPSYWNVVAFYTGIWFERHGPWFNAAVLAVLTVLTVLPVRFLYPNLAPRPWKVPLIAGGVVWALLVAAMVPAYPHVPGGLLWASLVYPALYAALSVYLDAARRRGPPRAP